MVAALVRDEVRRAELEWRWLSVRQAADLLDITEAAVRQRISRGRLSAKRLDGRVYVDRRDDFPYLPFRKGERLPALPSVGAGAPTSEMIEADAEEWQLPSNGMSLSVQRLVQEDGYGIILLHLDEQGA